MPAYLPSLIELLAAGLVLVLPGAALLAWQTGLRRDPLEWLADAVGLSISISALIALGAFLLSVSFTGPVVTALYALAALALVGGVVGRGVSGRLSFDWGALGLGLAGLAALAGLIAWRLVQADQLALPLWVDSVHHALVTQKILASGGLPADLAPELPVPFSYHYAFHLLAALFSQLTGSAVETTLLRFGQVLNGLVALSVYRLGKAVWGDVRRAALAALLAGFVAHMPAYYLTWGRYTLLTGLVVLPVAMAAAVELGRRPAGTAAAADAPPLAALGVNLALLTGGVALAHYTTLWLLGWFLVLWGLLRLPADLAAPRSLRRPVFVAALGALAGLALAGPWLVHMLTHLNHLAGIDVVEVASDQSGYLTYLGQLLGPRRNYVLLALAGGGLVINGLRRETRWLAGWGLLLGLLTLPWGLRFGPFRPDHYAIVLFLPAALLAADLIVTVADGIGRLAARTIPRLAWLQPALGLLVAAAAGGALLVWGLRETRQIVNPTTVLTGPEDVAALAWVAGHTSPEARFFINTTHWQAGAYRGVDGGYWLLPLAGRQSILPPAIAGWGEAGYVQAFTELARRASEVSDCGEPLRALIDEAALTHLYVKAGVGSLQPEALEDCPGVVLLYRRDGVYIYAVEAPPAGG
ncbi:MAG TPA: DUF6541 family protein [Anaerolineaceae bacterium]|nr:DUF6541 family protein [Anaerolineaceae bacterium]